MLPFDAPDPANASNREGRPKLAQVRLLVLEDGTNAVAEHALPQGEDDTVIIAQSGGERPMDFADRINRRILVLEQEGRGLARTVLLLSPRFDAGATGARMSLARRLSAHSEAGLGSSELIISAGDELDPAVQFKILALADELSRFASVGLQFPTGQKASDQDARGAS